MRSYSDIQALVSEINEYTSKFNGLPLLVGIDSNADYRTLLGLLSADPGKRIQHMSDMCVSEFPPHPDFCLTSVSKKAMEVPVIWIGAAQSLMFYGKSDLEDFFIKLAGTSVKGPMVLLCPYCCNTLESISQQYGKLGQTIVVLKSSHCSVPAVCLHQDADTWTCASPAVGFRQLLHVLEEGTDSEVIHVITSCCKKYLLHSVFPLIDPPSSYAVACELIPGLKDLVDETVGSNAEWKHFVQQLEKSGSLSNVCDEEICSVDLLASNFSDYLAGDNQRKFLVLVALKVFYGSGKDYLGAVLKKCSSIDDLVPRIYDTLLDYEPINPKLSAFQKQRKRLLASLEENSNLMGDFCARATIFGKNILRYLANDTEEERAAIIHALSTYPYEHDELTALLKECAPELALYLREYTFDEFNTKLLESDAAIRAFLTEYFSRYKYQKLTDHQDADFIEKVEKAAQDRIYSRLQSRTSIVKKLDKKNSQPYFFDALGVEYLAFIEAKAEEYGMLFDCQIGQCNLPSITAENKEFYDAFPEGSILKEEGLDRIKHEGTYYDFRFVTEPLHIFDELSLLDKNLKKFSQMLAGDKVSRIIILSDHGASRLAVTYRSENTKLELQEKGQHSGRCCPASEDPNIPFAYYEKGFSVLANYERFKGSRKADVEAHGGASLEETVVPVITLTAKPKQQQIFFAENVVKCSAKDGTTAMLFANPPLHEPRVVISGNSYTGTFYGDKHNIRFVMPDIRRKGKYDADIYDGGKRIATLKLETKRSTGMNDLF